MKWQDATSYSQGQRGIKAPSAWKATVGGFQILIMSDHLYHPGVWVMNCNGLGIKEKRLAGHVEDLRAVKDASINACWNEAKAQVDKLTLLADELFSIPDHQ